ncbi:uncharacterized protein LOC123564547 [Mercenaria mercenaria]|uniref:uncharacterized protein LOC123564547 n=1 Tax=Mercenaria mercenaria TaxID=6596 RepID=UPI00234F841B|nr:uncharacterized protein LOC123564547 [Mercenaria mercenaria]
MASSLRKWTIPTVYIWIHMFLFLDCMVCNVSGFSSYPNSTQSTLCAAQCEALCLDGVKHCERQCTGIKHWMTDCDRPNCTSSCSVLYTHHYPNRDHLVHVPHVSINRTSPRSVELSWNVPTQLSPSSSSSSYATIYIVEETHPDLKWSSVRSVAIKSWLRGTSVKFDLSNICNTDSYRVMAINEFGSMGFSSAVKIPALIPGRVQNINYTGNGVYYYVNKNNKSQSRFMAILQWDPPAGWHDSDILHYRWNPMVRRYCSDVSKDSLPIYTPMQNQSRHILMTIGSNSLDCVFTAQVQAVSKCNQSGPWTDFVVDLTNCSAITGYKCQISASDPPGVVEDVTLNISSIPVSVVMQMFSNPYIVNQSTKSPLLINLHVLWKPPSDLGSLGVIDHYTIRSGRAKRNLSPVPPDFIGIPNMINVSKDVHDLAFEIPTKNMPYTFGVQVIAVAPGQVIAENDWGLYEVRTIVVSRNDSGIGQFLQEGQVLLDKSGIVIVYINNSLPVQFLFDQPVGRMDNSSIDRYAVQWGPLVGPDHMSVENRTIVPLNQTSLSVSLQHAMKTYGVKMLYLREEEEDPMLEEWDKAPLMSFTLPFDIDQNETVVVEKIAVPEEQLTPLYITVGVVMAIILAVFGLRYLNHRHHFKHLERRLAVVDDDIAEDGDHYFIMRTSELNPDDIADIPTVVADHWELPHCCLKMGRVLGSGAFGQVVKGRVSKSMLMHRGTDTHIAQNGIGTHVTVAIKMLQDNADERHTENFLKEIDMMKDIGYHRNIVSILGCCTLRQPYCLVVENMPHGDLLAYFRNIRKKMQQRVTEGEGYINQDVDMFSPRDLLSVARQISTGMDFLAQKGFVHRDLAARNILVGDNKTVKIGDFGLARYIYHDVNKIYVTRRGGKLPLRWMSPEAIFNMTFSTASDIWSFGIVLYEIVTLGGAPYPALSNVELLQALKQGYRMARPDNCSQEIYDIMLDCWKEAPELRPSFSQICNVFTSMLEEDTYLEYFNFNVPLEHDYYRINSDSMDIDILDLDDQGIPTNIQNLTGTTCNKHFDPSYTRVTTEIPDDDCNVTEMSKAERNSETTTYTDGPFLKRAATTSSFNNGLYSTVDNTEVSNQLNVNIHRYPERAESTVSTLPTTQDNTADLLPSGRVGVVDDNSDARFNKPTVETRTSESSDDVFTNCPGCTRLTTDRIFADQYIHNTKHTPVAGDVDISQCPHCIRLDLHLTPFDIHVNERNDSAICSTASDDSDHSQSNQSESSMAVSDVYLMPESPSPPATTNYPAKYTDDMKDFNTFDFDLPDDIHKLRRPRLFENPCYTELCIGSVKGDRLSDGMLLKKKCIDEFLLKQGQSDNDIWCIAETKL